MPAQPELLVVYPNNRTRAFGELGTEIAAITPPVQAGLIAGYARSCGVSVQILDAEAANIDSGETARLISSMAPTLVCICTDYLNSGDVTKVAAALDTLRATKTLAPSISVVLEGVVPSAYPEKMLLEEPADYVCQGEAFQPIVNLVEHLRGGAPPRPFDPASIPGIWCIENGEVQANVSAPLVDPDQLGHIAWDLMPPTQYRAHHWHCFDTLDRRTPYASTFTNLGCPYSCTFCNVNVVAGGPNYRARSVETVFEELKYLVSAYGVRNVRIIDNVFTIRPDHVDKLCDLIIAEDMDLNMWAYARVETVRDWNMLKKMKKAGVNWLVYGFEAASEQVRRAVEKPSSQEAIEKAIDGTQQAGINILGNYIFGLPEDTNETMRMSLDMAIEYNFEWANFYSAMAYPGTELHAQVVEQGIPVPDKWSAYGQYSADAMPIGTTHVTPADVLKFRDEAFDEYFSNDRYRSLVRRKFGDDALSLVDKILSLNIPRGKTDTA